ncbi:MAG: OfxX fusion product [Hafnia sp.]
MRIKIKGEITAERLAQALQVASEKFEAARPGAKIYGANIYISAFDADGLPFDLVDHYGKSLEITIKAEPGELVKPALTAEGENRRQAEQDKFNQEQEEAEARSKKHMEQIQQMRDEREKREAEDTQAFTKINTLTAKFLEAMPEHFIIELNNTVKEVWDALKPAETKGKNKGQPRAMPVFKTASGSLVLSTDTWKNPRVVRNPICTLTYDGLTGYWKHDAWREVMAKIGALLEKLSGITPETFSVEKPILPPRVADRLFGETDSAETSIANGS